MIDKMGLLFASLHQETSGGAPEWIVAGLGNPGAQYEGTRHNAGFAALNMLSAKIGVRIERAKFKSMCGTGRIAGKQVLLLKPQTFMNLSGEAVAAAAHFYKLPMSHVLVLFDDISLPVGKLRVRRKGSAGGHNGIKSIIEESGTSDFPRIKLGVGDKPRPDYDLANWVLGRFSQDDRPLFAQSLERAADAVEELLKNGVGSAMNLYNA
ncbi:aminoacyl-tRNA hydrolase [Ethanoligenens sp.]|uniref:aminoacyl-tRNA hydrolase n=1 Tax=Ethanoligenens sp. TaxID=2099655 RepID=UPI0039E8DB4D